MINLYDTKLYLIICCLIIVILSICIFFWLINKQKNRQLNNKKKENFIDSKIFTTSDILEQMRHIPDTKTLNNYVSFEKLSKTIKESLITNIDNTITKINQKIDDLTSENIMDKLDIGTIIMWNKDELPKSGIDKSGPTMWAWCDGKEGRPDLKYRFPLGGKDYSGEEGKRIESENDGKLREHHIPKHRHHINHDGEDSIPRYNHSHNGNLEYKSWEHSHVIRASSGNYKNYKDSDIFQTDYYKQHSNDPYVTTNSKGNHDHDLKISHALNGIRDILNKHIVGDGPLYDGEQQLFYPSYELINFIIKID